MTRFQPLCFLALWLALPGSVSFAEPFQPTPDPMAHWRAQIEAARRLSIPPPPKGVRETPWNALSPVGWNPGQILQRLGISQVGDGDPKAVDLEKQIKLEWDKAPAVQFKDEIPIRLTGYPVMLSRGEGLAKDILLVPYRGACIHRPAPPANQMVMVSFKPGQGLPRNMDNEVLWVTGRIYALAYPTEYGQVAYVMPDARWQEYPKEKYPLPLYTPLR